MQNTPVEKNEEEQAQIKDMQRRGSKTQEEAEHYDQLISHQEDRQDQRNEPLQREIDSYYKSRNLSPFPPPLPKSSLWLETRRPSDYMFADIRPFYIACEQGDFDVVKSWINEKKEHLRQMGMQDGLACAAHGNQIETCRYLLDEAGSNIHGHVIREACKNLSLDLFKLCLEHGYHPNQEIPSRSGHFGTALRHCLENKDITRLLLENGADPNAAPWTDGRGTMWSGRSTPPMDRTSGLPLDLAVRKNNLLVVKLLLEHGADPSFARPFYTLVRPKDGQKNQDTGMPEEWRAMVDLLLLHGANINSKTYSGGTALHAAVFKKRWDVVEYLLEHGADPRVQRPVDGKDALTTAAVAAGVSREDSEEMETYVAFLLDDKKDGESTELQSPKNALQNPLVNVMQKVKDKRVSVGRS